MTDTKDMLDTFSGPIALGLDEVAAAIDSCLACVQACTSCADADLSESDIDVSLVGDQLTIRGEKRSEHEDKKDAQDFSLHRSERSYGAFQRTITVPYRVDPDLVAAQFNDGVLRITLPKPADALPQRQGRKIEINRSASPKTPVA